MNASDIQAVRDTLQKFQDGYKRRDISQIENFRALFVPEDDLEVIGTGAIEPGDDEWSLGPDAACGLILNDWEGWGDLALDVADARIHVLGEVAWLATTGTVTMDLDPTETMRDYLSYLQEVAGDETLAAKDRLTEILRGAAGTLYEAERGKQYVWPVRFTSVLVRRPGGSEDNGQASGERWLFHQIQFSFATTRFPDVRNQDMAA
jgi:SnoaL-like domain